MCFGSRSRNSRSIDCTPSALSLIRICIIELIVTSFLLIGLSLVGHFCMVIADQLRRPKRRDLRLGDDFHESLRPKRTPIYSPGARAASASA